MVEGNLWGIDMGGTKIECIILDKNRKILFRKRVPTEAYMGYQHILKQIKYLVDAMEQFQGSRPTSIGIGCPGTLSKSSGLMKNCNATDVNGKPFLDDLNKMLELKVKIANDANCFTLAETKLGVVNQKFAEAKVVFGVILGTGVGGGLVIDGKVLNGFHGISGEWGHNTLNDQDDRECFCGKKGDNESIISGPSLEWFYHRTTGTHRSLVEIVHLARYRADEAARKTMDRLKNGFAKAISVVVNIVDPDIIVIGGGIGNIDELYTDSHDRIKPYVFNNDFQTPIVKPALGDSAGVFGAAFLTE